MGNKNTKQVAKSNKKNNVKKSSNRIGFLLFVVVMFLVVLVSTVFSDLEQIVYNKTMTKELSAKYQELLDEEASLNSEVTKLQDPDYVARRAREEYMYTKDGEIILTIIDPAGKRIKSEITEE